MGLIRAEETPPEGYVVFKDSSSDLGSLTSVADPSGPPLPRKSDKRLPRKRSRRKTKGFGKEWSGLLGVIVLSAALGATVLNGGNRGIGEGPVGKPDAATISDRARSEKGLLDEGDMEDGWSRPGSAISAKVSGSFDGQGLSQPSSPIGVPEEERWTEADRTPEEVIPLEERTSEVKDAVAKHPGGTPPTWGLQNKTPEDMRRLLESEEPNVVFPQQARGNPNPEDAFAGPQEAEQEIVGSEQPNEEPTPVLAEPQREMLDDTRLPPAPDVIPSQPAEEELKDVCSGPHEAKREVAGFEHLSEEPKPVPSEPQEERRENVGPSPVSQRGHNPSNPGGKKPKEVFSEPYEAKQEVVGCDQPNGNPKPVPAEPQRETLVLTTSPPTPDVIPSQPVEEGPNAVSSGSHEAKQEFIGSEQPNEEPKPVPAESQKETRENVCPSPVSERDFVPSQPAEEEPKDVFSGPREAERKLLVYEQPSKEPKALPTNPEKETREDVSPSPVSELDVVHYQEAEEEVREVSSNPQEARREALVTDQRSENPQPVSTKRAEEELEEELEAELEDLLRIAGVGENDLIPKGPGTRKARLAPIRAKKRHNRPPIPFKEQLDTPSYEQQSVEQVVALPTEPSEEPKPVSDEPQKETQANVDPLAVSERCGVPSQQAEEELENASSGSLEAKQQVAAYEQPSDELKPARAWPQRGTRENISPPTVSERGDVSSQQAKEELRNLFSDPREAKREVVGSEQRIEELERVFTELQEEDLEDLLPESFEMGQKDVIPEESGVGTGSFFAVRPKRRYRSASISLQLPLGVLFFQPRNVEQVGAPSTKASEELEIAPAELEEKIQAIIRPKTQTTIHVREVLRQHGKDMPTFVPPTPKKQPLRVLSILKGLGSLADNLIEPMFVTNYEIPRASFTNVEQTLAKQGDTILIGDSPVLREHLEDFKPGGSLDITILHKYSELVAAHIDARIEQGLQENVAVLSPVFFSSAWTDFATKGTKPVVPQEIVERCKKARKVLFIQTAPTWEAAGDVIGCYSGHFFVVVIDRQKRVIYIVDSLPQTRSLYDLPLKFLKIVAEQLGDLSGSSGASYHSSPFVPEPGFPKQAEHFVNDERFLDPALANACGVFSAENLLCIAEGRRPNYSTEDVTAIRLRILMELFEGLWDRRLVNFTRRPAMKK